MSLLTRPVGRFPLGIWTALVLLVVALLLGSVGQAVSVASWDTALRWGLQEDRPASLDFMERSLVPVEWGTAVADVIFQTPLVLVALLGIARRHWVGLAAATAEFTILLYAALFYFFQRYGIKVWGTGDWAHWRGIAVTFLSLAGSLGALGLVCLWSNRGHFVPGAPRSGPEQE